MEDTLTESLERLADADASDHDAATLRGYIFGDGDEVDDEAYLTLTDVAMIFALGQKLTMPVARIRTDRISAW